MGVIIDNCIVGYLCYIGNFIFIFDGFNVSIGELCFIGFYCFVGMLEKLVCELGLVIIKKGVKLKVVC